MKIGKRVKPINNLQKKITSNKGFSLVELIIVIAILAIAVGIAGISISLAFSRDAERCAKTIDAALENARMNALSREGDFTLTIDNKTNELNLAGASTTKLQSGVTIKFSSSEGGISADKLAVRFDKTTGRVSNVSANGTAVNASLFRIECESSRGKRATIILVRATGKHYIEYN